MVVTHIPTGIKEKCEDTRSKIKNEKLAIARILDRLERIENDQKHEKQNDLRKKLISNKKQIRTYNYQRDEVIDHRTGKRANLKRVLDGDINLLK